MGLKGHINAVKSTEVRNVKFGILIPLTMYVITKNIFFNISRYLQENSRYRIWTILVSWLGTTLGDGKKIKKYFFNFRDFSG